MTLAAEGIGGRRENDKKKSEERGSGGKEKSPRASLAQRRRRIELPTPIRKKGFRLPVLRFRTKGFRLAVLSFRTKEFGLAVLYFQTKGLRPGALSPAKDPGRSSVLSAFFNFLDKNTDKGRIMISMATLYA